MLAPERVNAPDPCFVTETVPLPLARVPVNEITLKAAGSIPCVPVVDAADSAPRLGPPEPYAGETWTYYSDDPPRGWTTTDWPTPLPDPVQLKNYRFFVEQLTQIPGW